VFTKESLHSRLSAPQYAAVLEAVSRWLETDERPDAADVAALCETFVERYAELCRIDPAFRPAVSRE
jgi:hypothetical protein